MKKYQLLRLLILVGLSLLNHSCASQSLTDNTHTFPGADTSPSEIQQTAQPPRPETHQPQTFTAKVTRILDGDTIEVQNTNSILKIRLQGIDAPETVQPFGDTARQKLTNLILNKTITIKSDSKDKYDRLIAKVSLNNNDICLVMIRTGQAWWFTRYADSQSPSDRLAYNEAEDQSRQQRLGLWADPNPVPPWTFRHEQQQRQQN